MSCRCTGCTKNQILELTAENERLRADLKRAEDVRDLAREASNRDLETARSTSLPWYLEGRVSAWVISRIGGDHMQPIERAMRNLEESLELAQTEGVTLEQANKQAQHVFGRPAGDPVQEAGGVAVCLLAWCAARGVRLLDVALREVERIESKPIAEIRGSLARKADEDLVVCVKPKHQPFEYDPVRQSVDALYQEQCGPIPLKLRQALEGE